MRSIVLPHVRYKKIKVKNKKGISQIFYFFLQIKDMYRVLPYTLRSRVKKEARKVLKIKQKYKSKMIEYLSILIYFIIASLLALLILGLSFVFATRKADPEKISAYECGFDPFDDARSRFDVQFYLVAILFIIFDLEVTFLFPWALTLSKVGFFGFWSMMVFLLILTVGFVYEWRKGALDWS